jgi:hypothetical protein
MLMDWTLPTHDTVHWQHVSKGIEILGSINRRIIFRVVERSLAAQEELCSSGLVIGLEVNL